MTFQQILGPFFDITADAIRPKTDFTLETNRKSERKTTEKYSKPCILPLGLRVQAHKISFFLGKIQIFNSKACFGVPEPYWNTLTKT